MKKLEQLVMAVNWRLVYEGIYQRALKDDITIVQDIFRAIHEKVEEVKLKELKEICQENDITPDILDGMNTMNRIELFCMRLKSPSAYYGALVCCAIQIQIYRNVRVALEEQFAKEAAEMAANR